MKTIWDLDQLPNHKTKAPEVATTNSASSIPSINSAKAESMLEFISTAPPNDRVNEREFNRLPLQKTLLRLVASATAPCR
jgi:hypothetical protein